MENPNYDRMPAIKIDIASLRSGSFVENKEQWSPNYVKTRFGDVSRVNIIGILVSLSDNMSSIIIDDGTGPIQVNLNFAMNKDVIHEKGIKEGDGVIVIGRPREFDRDLYIAAEIVNSLDNLAWLRFRKGEIERQAEEGYKININHAEHEDVTDNEMKKEDGVEDLYEITRSIIEKKDSGDGVDISVVERELINLNISDPKDSIQRMLEQGDLFEIRPGRIKLL